MGMCERSARACAYACGCLPLVGRGSRTQPRCGSVPGRAGGHSTGGKQTVRATKWAWFFTGGDDGGDGDGGGGGSAYSARTWARSGLEDEEAEEAREEEEGVDGAVQRRPARLERRLSLRQAGRKRSATPRPLVVLVP